MALWLKKVLCGFVFLLAAAQSQRVDYPGPVCAVRGSSVSLLCTFSPAESPLPGGEEVTRVLWCQNHLICQGSTPTVYDSQERNNRNNPRYRYQGDQRGRCSLHISDVRREDNSTLRFRMEAKDPQASFTGQAGVRVSVVDGPRMEIRASSDGAFKRGGAVTLNCTARCTFHQLEVTWYRDGHALQFTGPALHLGPLTAEDSGNYTCGLKKGERSLSSPYGLLVEAEEEGGVQVPVVVGVVFGVLLVLCSLVLLLCLIRRFFCIRRTIESQPSPWDSRVQRAGAGQEASGDEDAVSYAPIRIKARSHSRRVQEEDAIVYSTLAGRA